MLRSFVLGVPFILLSLLLCNIWQSLVMVIMCKNTINSEDEAAMSLSSIRTRREARKLSKASYRIHRGKDFLSWFERPPSNKKINEALLKPNADANGTIMDFAIVGFPKCGTTSMIGNLGSVAPMPAADVHKPVHQAVFQSYMNWPEEYGHDKILRGTKNPMILYANMRDWNKYLPRTKLIIGLRHPILLFESWWNHMARIMRGMLHHITPYNKTGKCLEKPCPRCPNNHIFCMQMGRFHVFLASMGKTELSNEERHVLAWDDLDGGESIENFHMRNPIFMYDVSELRFDYVWEDLADYLDVDPFPHERRFNGAPARNVTKVHHPTIDICDEKYNKFRAMMMPIAHEVSQWLLKYFIPLAENPLRKDVHITNTSRFREIVREYSKDPCEKLTRVDDGTYALV